MWPHREPQNFGLLTERPYINFGHMSRQKPVQAKIVVLNVLSDYKTDLSLCNTLSDRLK